MLLWWQADDPGLGSGARDLIARGEPIVSGASFWEVAIKASLGKIAVDVRQVMAVAHSEGMIVLGIGEPHVAAVQDLPHHHRDPFDRLLIAQALIEGLPILTGDTAFRGYAAELIDAIR